MGLMEWCIGDIRKAFVYAVLFNIGRVPADNRVHSTRIDTIGFIVRSQYHGLRTNLPDLFERYTATNAELLCFICCRRHNAALKTCYHWLATEGWISCNFAGSKKCITIDMNDGSRK